MANAPNLRVIEVGDENPPNAIYPKKDVRKTVKGKHQDYVKLFSHAITSKLEVPSMKAVSWSADEKKRIDKGLCVLCGDKASEETSYICRLCAEKDTLEDIREEIDQIREEILNQDN